MKNKSLLIVVIITIALIGIVVYSVYNKTQDNGENNNNENQDTEKGIFNKNAKLDDIVHTNDKINIYFFWGDGCPHCKEEYEWFEYVKEQYGDKFNLYGFETWYHSDNAELLNKFASAMGDSVTGVPYTIMGDKSYIGFSTAQYGFDFLNQITNAKDNKVDIYFDKVKGSE